MYAAVCVSVFVSVCICARLRTYVRIYECRKV